MMRMPHMEGRQKGTPPRLHPNGQEWEPLMVHRVQYGLQKDEGWRREIEEALNYYDSEQYRRGSLALRDRNRARWIANYIRTDIDRQVSGILDAEPVIRPTARHPSFHSQAQAMIELVQYSQDREMDYQANKEKCIESMIQTGEAILFEGWDQYENDGLGAAVSRRVDARNILVDPAATMPQKDDARYVILLSWEDVTSIANRFGMDRVLPEPENLLLSHWMTQQDLSSDAMDLGPTGDERAWVVTMYHRTHDSEARYLRDGREMKITRAEYLAMAPPEQEGVQVVWDRNDRLWEATMVNGRLVEHRLSPYDKSLGGHGMYPMAFFSNVEIDGRHRARGEIAYLMSVADIRNEALSSFLDHIWLANTGFLDVPAGSFRPEERRKLDTIGEKRFSVVERMPGSQPAEWRGVDPSTLNAFQHLLPTIESVHNRESGTHNSSRGQAEFAGQSGRLARVLQAADDRLNIVSQHHVEAALRRSLLLRLHNLGQFTYGTFIAEVIDPDTKEARPLYVGRSQQEILTQYNLQIQPHPTTGAPVYVDEAGEPANLLALTEDLRASDLFQRIRLTLDTDRKANKLERMEQAQAVLNVVGEPAMAWYVEEMELSNPDKLLQGIEEANQQKQTYDQLEGMAKSLGLEDVGEMMQLLSQQVQQLSGQQGQQGPPAPPQGPQGPQLNGNRSQPAGAGALAAG